jgi:hypothetical protein
MLSVYPPPPPLTFECVNKSYGTWYVYGKVRFPSNSKRGYTINRYSDGIFFSTATCFGPHGAIIRQYYDCTAKVIELLNMDPYLVQHVHIMKLCLS